MQVMWRICIVVFVLCACAGAYEEVVVFPKEKGVQINRFFYDLKSPSAPKKFDKAWAKTLLEDYNFNGIRTSIYGTDQKPAHPGPGEVIGKFYEPETEALKLAKKIRPDTIVFASKKLDGTKSFPDWTKNSNGVVPEKYAVLLIDYLEYMKKEGLEVDVLAIDNERRWNEGNIMPETHREIIEELRRLTKERGLKMPKTIGHEDFAMGRNDWMELFKKKGGDTMDIFGGHYYPEWRQLDRLQSDLEYAGDREKWHTELHWDSKPADDPFLLAVKAYLALWDCTDNGMNGLMWWAFNPKRDIRDELMHAGSVPLVNAYPLKVIDPDGSETVDEMELHTRAFLQDDTLTIYALNLDPSREWKDLRFKLASGRIVGDVEGRMWADGFPDEGKTGKIKPYTSRIFRVDLAPRTINIFTLKFK